MPTQNNFDFHSIYQKVYDEASVDVVTASK